METKDEWLPEIRRVEESIKDIQSSETALYNTIMIDTCHCTFAKPIECTVAKKNPSVKVWTLGENKVSMWFMNGNKWITSVGFS